MTTVHNLDWIAICNAFARLWPDGTLTYQAGDHPRTQGELAQWADNHPAAWQRLRAQLPELPHLTPEIG